MVSDPLHNLELSESGEDVDRAWAEEVRSRLQAIREGRVRLRDWDDALADILKSITRQGSE